MKTIHSSRNTPTLKQPHDYLFKKVTVCEPGFDYVSVSNEHPTCVAVYFACPATGGDDITITHTPSPMVSSSDYFAFGLQHTAGERAGVYEQRHLYNYKELQDELNVGWLDYGARMYQSEIARFFTQDRFSEKYYPLNPYQYGASNPLIFIDHKGDSLIKVIVNDESGYIKGENTLYIDHTIFSDVQDILNAAVETGTYIHINSSFRTNKKQEELNGSKDAITPASAGNSPHNAGLAIDFNVYTDNDVSKGIESGNKNLKSDNAFIKKVKEKGWRYGGDFKDPDRVHIDKRGTDENFKSIRDANQTQVDGNNKKTVDDTKVKRTEFITIKKKDDEK